MVVFDDGSTFGTIGGGRYEKNVIAECRKAIKTKKPTTLAYQYFGRKGESVCGGEIKVFIEPVIAQDHLIICGGGHIALPLSAMGKILAFRVTVIDDRREFANKKRFPHVDQIVCGPYAKALTKIAVKSNSYVTIVTRGHECDFDSLKTVVKSSAAYVGVISSSLKKIKFFRDLRKLGVEEKFLRRIHIPMGIDIGAQTPEEIAVSIMAQVLAVRNKDQMGTDKFKENKS